MKVLKVICTLLVSVVLLAFPTWEKADGFLGAVSQNVIEEQAATAGVRPQEAGVKIVKTISGTPADGLLEPGDYVLTLDNAPVKDEAGFIAAVRAKVEGTMIELGVLRAQQHRKICVNYRSSNSVGGVKEYSRARCRRAHEPDHGYRLHPARLASCALLGLSSPVCAKRGQIESTMLDRVRA